MLFRRFLIVLAALVTLTACPQASQFLTPGTFEADKPASSEEQSLDKTDDKTDDANDADKNPGPEATSKPPPRETSERRLIAQGPTIEPKNDQEMIPVIKLYTEERLRYDPDNPIVLPKEGSAEINMRFVLEGRSPWDGDESDPESFWHPFMDGDPVEGVQIRMIYLPAGKTEADAKFCDTLVNNETLKTKGTNVFFSVKVGPGEIRFYDVVVIAGGYDTMNNKFMPPTSDFHDHGFKAFKSVSAYQNFVSDPSHPEIPLVPLPAK